MPPPNALQISTSSIQRLIKEEASYHKELKSQEARLEKLLAAGANGDAEARGEEGNREFEIKQERTAIQETRAVFPQIRKRIEDAVRKLEDQIESGSGASEEETAKAKEMLETAKKVLEADETSATHGSGGGMKKGWGKAVE